jgi:hypothetical protein
VHCIMHKPSPIVSHSAPMLDGVLPSVVQSSKSLNVSDGPILTLEEVKTKGMVNSSLEEIDLEVLGKSICEENVAQDNENLETFWTS